MPGFDKTGPMGMGPGSGRGYGPCGFGLGWRRRFGMNRGMGRYFGWNWPENKEDQKKALKDYIKSLNEELEDAQKELKELDDQA